MTDALASAPFDEAAPTPRGRVLVVTPVGLAGRGGIDRLNFYFDSWIRAHQRESVTDYLGSRGEHGGLRWPLHFIGALLRFVLAMAGRRYDLVHIHVSTDGSALRKVWFGRIARLFGTPYVIQFHGIIFPQVAQKNPPWLRALRNLAQGARRVVILGETFRGDFERVVGVDPARLVVVHNGIPDMGVQAVIPRPERETIQILFTGAVGERKGVDLLVDALGRLRDSGQRWNCVIAGDGALEPWKARAAALGIEDRVRFPGWLEVEAVRALMREADIVVLPSRAEALPLSLIEGASAGAALVATDIGATREIVIDGDNGLIVEPDAQALADALAGLLADRARRSAMQNASRALYLDRFAMDRYVRDILAVYEAGRADIAPASDA